MVNENGAVYAFSYDALDRLIQETGFDKRTTRYQHDAAGRPTLKVELGVGDFAPVRRAANDGDAPISTQQIETHYKRDGAGRLIEKLVTRPQEENALRTRYQYDALGRLNFAANDNSNVALEYDALGQLTLERATNEGQIKELRHEYDALGNRIATTLPDGRTLNHLFYGSGHLHQINLDGEVVSDIERDNAHREIKRTQGALNSSFAYDPVGRLTQQLAQLDPTRTAKINTGSLTQQRNAWQALEQLAPGQINSDHAISRQYEYDKAGNLLAIKDAHQGNTQFQYDALGRILSSTQPKSSETFRFDPAHNLLDQGATSSLVDNSLTVFEDKRYRYDAHGNLLEKKIARHTEIALEWNLEHQLVRSRSTRNAQADAPTIQETHYSYDPFGRRIAKRDSFGITQFTWDGNRLLSETRGSHSRTYLYEGTSFVPLAQVDNLAGEDKSNILYFHTDHLGTPRELTDVQGQVQWAATYKAWGNVLQVQQVEVTRDAQALEQLQALRFQGQYFDIETGLHYNRFRYFDPDIGRFVSQDPIGLHGGNNLYQYAANPSGWVDPLGLTCVCNVVRGPNGEPVRATATITPADIGTGTATNESSRASAKAMGNVTDDAGHIVGKLLGGSGGKQGVFPQLPNINRGQFAQFEKGVADAVRSNGPVDVDIQFQYANGGTRPTQVIYDVYQNGTKVLGGIFGN